MMSKELKQSNHGKATRRTTLSPRLRQHLLTNLDAHYAQRFKDTLDMQAHTALDPPSPPIAVAPRLRLDLHGSAQSHDIPAGTPIAQVFDQAGGELLILGTPGAGKTTLLLELAQVLLARARADAHHPIPVMINLACWGRKVQPLDRWLAYAINAAAGISKRRARRLLTGRHLLLLLDGLNDVAEEQRAACIAAINMYCEVYRPPRIIKHYVLRFLLALPGLLPWNAVRFLDTACGLLFLQRDGGIYRFRHMLLRDYFAALTEEEIEALAKE